jgi:hypothetical protein
VTVSLRRSAAAVILVLSAAACAAPAATPATSTPAPTGTNAPAASPGVVDPSPAANEGLLEGSITGEDGAPIEGAQVGFQTDDVASCCADEIAPGRYRAPLAPGTYTVSFTADGFIPVSRPVAIAAGQRVVLDVVLVAGDPAAESVPVLVVDPDAAPGAPVDVATVLSAGRSGTLTVSGGLIGRAGGDIELCSAVLESYPPQCGRPSLVVRGLDLSTIAGLKQDQGVIWVDRPVTLTGEVTLP